MIKRKCLILELILFFLVMVFIVGSLVTHHEVTKDETVTYQVTCVDDVLTGIVVKKGDRYYRQGGTDSVWIPMQQCALEPIK